MDQHDFTTEQWKPVVGYEGIYEVSDFGRVRRIKSGPHTHIGRVLKCSPCNKGYPSTLLSRGKGDKAKYITVHSMVAQAFLGPYPPGCEVNHIDSVRHNNHISNLEYVTHQKNIKHGFDAKAKKSIKWLTDEQVDEIRRRFRPCSKSNAPELAKEFGITRAAIYMVINRQTHKKKRRKQL